MASFSVVHHIGVALAVFSLATVQVRAEQPTKPQIVFAPVAGVTQHFQVRYRVPYAGAPSASDGLRLAYKLAVTPTKESSGYRLKLQVSDVQHPGGPGMDMVVAAALMLDGLPFHMLVDDRGFLQGPADWPTLQRELQRRADALPPEWFGVARSVPDGHSAEQVAWHLARALDAMNFARSYTAFAKSFGASTITWHGGLRVDVTISPPDADGGMAVSWALPSGEPKEGEGRGIIRRDGFVAPLVRSVIRGGSEEIHEIEPLAGSQ